MEPTNRKEREKRLKAILILLLLDLDDDWLLRGRVSRKKLAEWSYRGFLSEIGKNYEDAFNEMENRFGSTPIPPIEAERRRDKHVDDWVKEFAKRIKQRMKDYRRKRKEWEDNGSPEDEEPIFYDPTDAEREAATTVTGSWSKGEVDGADVLRKYRTELTPFWFTEPGACKVCAPLHGMGRASWADRFPDGPPSHPNCRCYLEWYRVLE